MTIPYLSNKIAGPALAILVAAFLCGGSFFAGQKYDNTQTTPKSHVSAVKSCGQFKKFKNKDKPARCRTPVGRTAR